MYIYIYMQNARPGSLQGGLRGGFGANFGMDSAGFWVDFESILEWIPVSFVLTVGLGRHVFLGSFQHLSVEFWICVCVCLCVRALIVVALCICMCADGSGCGKGRRVARTKKRWLNLPA